MNAQTVETGSNVLRTNTSSSLLPTAICLSISLVTALITPLAAAEFVEQQCTATGTVGFHDYGGGVRSFEPSVFHESIFHLQENALLSRYLEPDAEQTGPLPRYLTLVQDRDRQELECTPVRTGREVDGVSCINQPPTTLLLYNPDSGRFTRSSLAAWTFSTPEADGPTTGADPAPDVAGSPEGESLFVEFGRCRPAAGSR